MYEFLLSLQHFFYAGFIGDVLKIFKIKKNLNKKYLWASFFCYYYFVLLFVGYCMSMRGLISALIENYF